MEKRRFNIVNKVMTTGQNVTVDRYCNAWLAVNKGDALVTVNGMPLKPYPPGHPELSGESYGVSGNEGEIFTGDLKIVFDVSGAPANPLLVLTQKYYIP